MPICLIFGLCPTLELEQDKHRTITKACRHSANIVTNTHILERRESARYHIKIGNLNISWRSHSSNINEIMKGSWNTVGGATGFGGFPGRTQKKLVLSPRLRGIGLSFCRVFVKSPLSLNDCSHEKVMAANTSTNETDLARMEWEKTWINFQNQAICWTWGCANLFSLSFLIGRVTRYCDVCLMMRWIYGCRWTGRDMCIQNVWKVISKPSFKHI